MARFRPSVILEARERAGLSQLQLATLAEEVVPPVAERPSSSLPAEDRTRRIASWLSRIGAWERGVDTPSAPYVPSLARLLDVEPLAMFDVDPLSPPFTVLRLVWGFTLQGLADATGISYTSMHRMLRGVTNLPDGAAGQLAWALYVTPEELRGAIARDR